MSARCPTCGQPLPVVHITTADQLIMAMRELGDDRQTRDVYRSVNGSGYYVTYAKDARVSREAIEVALQRGLIALTYPNCTDMWSLPEKSAECHQKYNEWLAKHTRPTHDPEGIRDPRRIGKGEAQ